MHITKFNLLALALLLCGPTGFAQRKALTVAEADALKAELTANARDLKSLQSDFTQTKQLSYLDEAIRSAGKLYFRAPGKIRWEYLSPTNYAVIFNGQTMHTIEDGRIKSTNLEANRRMQGLNDLLAGSLPGGDMLDENRFDITYYRDQTYYIAILAPKDKGLSRFIRQVELAFDGTSLLPTRIRLTDPAGDTTQLTFTNQRRNVPVSDTMFRP